MQQQVITQDQYEEYVLTDDKQNLIDKMIKGTTQHFFFSMLYSLSQEQTAERIEKQIELMNQYKCQDEYLKNVFLKTHLNQLQIQNGEEEIKKAIQNINKLLQIRVDQFGQQKKGVIQQMEDEKEEEGLSKINKQIIYEKCNITKNDYTLEKIKKLTNQGIDQLDPSILFNLEKDQFEIVTYYLQKKQDLYRIENLPLLLFQFQQNHYEGKRNFDQLIETFQLYKLSIQQIEEIGELIPDLFHFQDFVNAILCKKFPFDSNLNLKDKNQIKAKLDLIKQIIKYIDNKSIKFKVKELVWEFIQISSSCQEYDFDMFFRFLEINHSDNQSKNKNVFSRKELKKYLKQYMKINNQFNKLYLYSDKNFIDKLKMRQQLLEGKNIENIDKHFSQKEIQQLESKKILKILQSNNRVYEVNEAIDLEVKIKNINKIEVKVFQLNSEQYYLKNMRQFDGNIDLGGLIANYQTEFKFDLKAIEKKITIFNLDSPQIKEPGVFLIEFIGNGLSSRIVIQKGKIYLNQKLSLTGIKVQLFDEKLEICKEKRVGIYVKQKFIKAKENGEIEIPFQNQQENCQVVVVNDKLSQLMELQLLDEQYTFKCNLIYHNESIIENNQAKFILQPMLLLHNLQASFKLISDFIVTVSQTNDKGIVNKQIIDVPKHSLLPNSDIELSVQIVKGVSRISFNYQITVLTLSKGSIKLNADDKQILINNHIDANHYTDNICCQYLKKNKEGYKIYLLGKTGEPKIDQILNVKLVSRFYEDSNNKDDMVELKTDQKGAVDLGMLENIKFIYSEVKSAHYQVDSCKWTILNDTNYVRYNNLISLKGQIITLPINPTHPFSLYQVDLIGSYNFIQDKIQHCVVADSVLTIKDLDVGVYQVSIDYEQFTINVINGTLIQNTIISDQLQVNTITNPNYVHIQQVSLKDNALSIQTNKQNVKINIIAFNFYDNSIKQVIDFLSDIHPPYQQDKPNHFPDAQIFNNKQLADELVYVLDRKSQQRFVGNNLNKPKILLNQQFNQNTQYDNENLSKGKDFDIDRNYDQNMLCASKEMKYMQCSQNLMYDEHPYRQQINEILIPFQDYLNGDLKFLKNKSLILSNLKSDENGLIKVDIESQKYQQILVIMNDNNQVVYRVLDLEDKEIEVKNLVQQQMNQEEKCFISSRLHSLVLEGEEVKMDDINKVEFQLVDNLEQVFTLMNTIQESSEMKEWEFLVKWESLDLLQKHKHYYKQSCHELNIFLYFNDRVYFDLYVSTFIKNKIEKTFIDYFLLQDHQKICSYLHSQLLSTLNPCELILLLNYLQRHSSQHFNQIYSYIEQQIVKNDFNTFKKRFDTIINSNNNDLKNEILPSNQVNSMFSAPVQHCGLFSAAPQMRMQKLFKVESPQQRSMRNNEKLLMMEQECLMDYNNEVLEEEEKTIKDMRKKYVKGYDQLEPTKEYIEKQYIHKNVSKQNGDYCFSEFYQDYIKYLIEKKEKGFISSNFIMSTNSISEKILVLSLMDLQFNKVSHVFKNEVSVELKITAKSNMILFKKEFKEGEKKLKQDILISQRLFDPKDKFTMEDDYRVEKEVQEFIVNKVYGCQLVITNCSVAEHLLQILYQIPENSMPVNSLDYIAQINKVISSFSTQTFEFFFYFPSAGNFRLTPATVNRNNQTIAVAPLQTITVNLNRTKINSLNLHDILLSGTESDILNYIQQTNLFKNQQDLYNILYLFNQKPFYNQAMQILEQKKFLNQDVLSYSIVHSDKQRFFQLLQFHTNSLQSYIYQYQNDFININKIQLKEYNPIMNSRVHQLKDKKILNIQFREQYTEFLKYLAEKKQLENQDRIVLCYYLILQDRIEEAIKVFKKVDEGQQIECQIQYDYLKCYLDFYNTDSNYEVSRNICDKYLDYPILHWRNSFYEVANLLAEYDGEEIQEQEILEDLQKNKKKQEQHLKLECENHQLVIEYMNIQEVQLFLYKIDLEIIFSINPFMDKAEDNLLMLIPNSQFKLQLQESNMVQIQKIDIPEQFRNNNLHIMVQSDDKKSSITYLPNQLDIHIQEDIGQIRIYEKSNRKPLKSVYIKTFVKLKDNSVQFYKDGYTDLVGGFNYSDCSSNSDLITKVTQFSILISTDSFGSIIKQANPVNTLNHFDHNILKGKNIEKFNQRMIQQTQVYNQSKQAHKK